MLHGCPNRNQNKFTIAKTHSISARYFIGTQVLDEYIITQAAGAARSVGSAHREMKVETSRSNKARPETALPSNFPIRTFVLIVVQSADRC
jgi:hypothetical protein